MNWQVPLLDNMTLISNSDLHSLHRLGREANVLEMNERDFSYAGLMRILKSKNPDAFTSTIEFFPQEGRYHLDGHRDCKYSATPEQTRRLGGACPVCGKQLLKGVQHRVEVLGTRQSGFTLPGSVPFTRVLPLEEAMAQALGVGPSSKKVQMLYNQAVLKASEFSILFNLSGADLCSVVGAPTALAIEKVRRGNVKIEPGYDGQYGVVEVFTEEERRGILEPQKQLGLF